MSEKTREVPQLADTTYANTLVIESTHEYNVHGPYEQSMSIGSVGKFGHLSGFLRHFLLNSVRFPSYDSHENIGEQFAWNLDSQSGMLLG